MNKEDKPIAMASMVITYKKGFEKRFSQISLLNIQLDRLLIKLTNYSWNRPYECFIRNYIFDFLNRYATKWPFYGHSILA